MDFRTYNFHQMAQEWDDTHKIMWQVPVTAGENYGEDVNQWCIVVSGSYKQTNFQTGTSNGSAGGAFGHDTTDPESNMAWWNQFVTSEATEW